MTTLVFVFKKVESDDKTKCDIFYSQANAETIINDSDIDAVFESIHTTIISNIQNFYEKVQAGLLIQSEIMILIFQNIIP